MARFLFSKVAYNRCSDLSEEQERCYTLLLTASHSGQHSFRTLMALILKFDSPTQRVAKQEVAEWGARSFSRLFGLG